jgi:mannose-6-phosphate isomerase-like protein (cupin superfamily)
LVLAAGLLYGTGSLAVAQAQQAAVLTAAPAQTIKRTPLQRFDVPGTNYETLIDGGWCLTSIGRHTHPGPESGYVLEGEMVLMIEGQPDKLIKAGESYQVPPGAIHDGRAGPKGAKVVATYVVEKGKPHASPAK